LPVTTGSAGQRLLKQEALVIHSTLVPVIIDPGGILDGLAGDCRQHVGRKQTQTKEWQHVANDDLNTVLFEGFGQLDRQQHA